MNELVEMLVKNLGVQQSQAQGGAGLLFKLAQDKLGGDFSKVASALPGVQDLINQAPPQLPRLWRAMLCHGRLWFRPRRRVALHGGNADARFLAAGVRRAQRGSGHAKY